MKKSFLTTLTTNPRQLRLRKAAFQIHLWSGILLSLYIAAIGLSGSILVFKEELLPHPHIPLPHTNPQGCTPPQLLQALQTAHQTYPALPPTLVSCPDQANPLINITLTPAKNTTPLTLNINPQTGALLAQSDEQHSWVTYVDRFHIELFLTGTGPKNGRRINGIAAAILLAIALTGAVIWWPGIHHWTRSLQVDFRRSFKRINWDLHNAIGIWTLAFTLIWAVSGISFAWEDSVARLISHVSPIVTARYPAEVIANLATRNIPPNSPPLDLPQVLTQAAQLSPHGKLEGLFYGSGPKPILTVYMARQRPGDFNNTDFLYFDQLTGAHLYTWRRGQNQTLGDWLLWLLYPLHVGTSWGLPIKILWAAAGLAFPILAVSGLLMYWNRWLGKRLKAFSQSV